MDNNIDIVEFVEKYFDIELLEYQKVMLRMIDKHDDFIRGRRLSNQESLCFGDESRVDLDFINAVLEPFRVEIQDLLGKEDDDKNVDQ